MILFYFIHLLLRLKMFLMIINSIPFVFFILYKFSQILKIPLNTIILWLIMTFITMIAIIAIIIIIIVIITIIICDFDKE